MSEVEKFCKGNFGSREEREGKPKKLSFPPFANFAAFARKNAPFRCQRSADGEILLKMLILSRF
jgi:hypothetical protein